MAGWRDHLRAKNTQLHAAFGVRAVYALREDQVGVAITVRMRIRWAEAGPQDQSFGRALDADIRAVIDLAELSPMPNAHILLAPDEAYRLVTGAPARMNYVEFVVTRVSESKAATLWANAAPPDFVPS